MVRRLLLLIGLLLRGLVLNGLILEIAGLCDGRLRFLSSRPPTCRRHTAAESHHEHETACNQSS